MKILIITYYFPPQNYIAAQRPYSWAKYWSKMGHDVTVLIAKKFSNKVYKLMFNNNFKVIKVGFPLNNIKKRNNNIKTEKKNINVQLSSFIIKKIKNIFNKYGIVNSTSRMPNITELWARKSIKKILQLNESWDLVISTSGPYTSHLIAYKIKINNLTNYWIADYRDLWTENHIFKGIYPFKLIEEYLEKKINKNADIITTVSDGLADVLIKKYNLNNVFVIPNGFDLDDLKLLPEKKYWNDNKIRILYTGSIYKNKQDPSPLFESIKYIDNSEYKDLLNNLEVVFLGGNIANLIELIRKFNVEKWVKYLGFLERKKVLHMQRDAHVLLFLEFYSKKIKGILTGKLFEYLFSGTEIWAIGISENSESGKLIIESGCGKVLGNNVELITKELIKLLEKKEKPKIYPKWDVLKYYTREYNAKKLLNLIKTNIKSIK